MRQAEQVRYLVLAAQREGNRRLAADLLPLDLTPAQAEILRILGDHTGLTVDGVGEMLVCDSGINPSRLVDRLVRAGLVERTNDADDRRRVRLALTTEGLRVEGEVRLIEDAMYSEIDTLPGVAQLVGTLTSLVAGQPAGEALKRRIG